MLFVENSPLTDFFYMQLLTKDEITTMKEATFEDSPMGYTKLFEPVYKLLTGQPIVAALGLEVRMCINTGKFYSRVGKGVEGIQEEVDSFAAGTSDPAVKEVKELLHYIRFEVTSEKKYKNGVRDLGRGQMRLSDFMENPKVQAAHLDEAEVVAMRLYTTAAFAFMNKPLRDDERYWRSDECPLPVATHFAKSGIKKLRSLHVGSGQTVLWRGMRNLDVADDFMSVGGTELAFMSTTLDLRVAVSYCISSQALLFKIVTPDFMAMGADVRWLSAFPAEKEILYPPCTYLKPTGRVQVIICSAFGCTGVIETCSAASFVCILMILQQTVQIDRNGHKVSFKVVEVHPQLS